MNSLSILIIDDNDSIRLSLSSYLEDMGYYVFDASNGSEGIKIIDSENPDIVLTDIYMPGVSGIDVLQYIKENSSETPVIVISGAGEIDSVVSALRWGAWDYITKPIEDLNFLSYTIDKVAKRVALLRENKEKSIEIENKNKELNEAIGKLQSTQKQLIDAEKMASLGYMVTGVAHEINTPLGVCLTSISFLKDETKEIKSLNDKKEMKLSNFNHYLETISDITKLVSDSLGSINNLITNFKQLSVDQQEVTLKDFLINDAILSVINIGLSFALDKELEVEVTGDKVIVNSYPEVINRIFLKLSENSIIHGFRKKDVGSISVHIQDLGNKVEVVYFNSGEAIPDDLIDKIFDPFVTESKTDGSGLGLCIVYNLINFKLSGEITCKNVEGGVEFRMHFPKVIK